MAQFLKFKITLDKTVFWQTNTLAKVKLYLHGLIPVNLYFKFSKFKYMKCLTVSITYKIKHLCTLVYFEKIYSDLCTLSTGLMCSPFEVAVGRHKVHKAVAKCFCIYFIVLLGSCLLFHTCSSMLRTYLKRGHVQINR